MKLPIEEGDLVGWRYVGDSTLNQARIIGIRHEKIIAQINPFWVIAFPKNTLKSKDEHGSAIELVPLE